MPIESAPVGHRDSPVNLANDGLVHALTTEFFGMAPQFIATWVIINLTYLMGYRRSSVEIAPSSADAMPKDSPDSSSESGLQAMLKPALGRDLVMLRSDLNYVHVYTTKGQTILLYSLARGRGTWRPRIAGTSIRLGGIRTCNES